MSDCASLQQWLETTERDVTILERVDGGQAFGAVGLPEESSLALIAHRTGGVVVDNGWLRITGGGAERMPSMRRWTDGSLLVGYDAVGGVFVTNGPHSTVRAFMVDEMDWTETELSHAEFVRWALHGDLSAFYEGLRWTGWEEEVRPLPPDRGLFLYPPPFTREGKDVGSSHHGEVAITELWELFAGGAFLDQVAP